MRFRFPKIGRVWTPLDEDADARFYRSDAGVTSASSATRHRAGRRCANYFPATALVGAINDSTTTIVVASTSTFRQAAPYELIIEDETVNVTAVAGTTLTVTRGHAGSVAAAHSDGTAVRLSPQDGQSLLALPSGRLIMMGGAGMGHAGGPDERVNIIWYSDDKGLTWDVLLGDSAGSSTRPARAHTFGGFTATFGGVLYVYWLGGDPFYPTGDVFRIPASALDVGGDPNTAWTRISTTCPTSGLALYMYGVLGTTIYVIGGQVSINDGAASKKAYKSIDQGATWTEIGTNIVPADVWGQQLGPLPELNGKLWICGSGRYDSVVNDFSNAVYWFDGTTFTQVLANGHAQFPKSRYHSAVTYKGRLWRFNGTTWDGATLDSDTRAAHYSSDGATWTEWTAPIPWPETHAQAVLATEDAIYLTAGFQAASLYTIREHTGALVSSWADQGEDGLDLLQATDGEKPIYDPLEFDGRGGLVFTPEQFLELAAPDIGLTDGFFEVWFVAKTLNFATGATGAIVIGNADGAGSTWNRAGFDDDAMTYTQAGGGTHTRGSGLTDDRPHLFGIVHQSGSLKFYVDGVQVGSTQVADVVFHTTYTGWDAVGRDYLTTIGAAMVMGALLVRTTGSPSSSDFISKLATFAELWGA